MLPPLRQELTLQAGESTAAGQPTWVLHDPSANQFYQLGWPAFEILSRWSLGEPARIIAAVNAETTLTVGEAEVQALLELLVRHNLLIASGPENTERLLKMREAGKLSHAQWLLKNYLFFRVPLIRPMPLLKRIAPWLTAVYTPAFWYAIAAIAITGLYLVSQRWEEFTHTFSSYSGLEGLLGIGIALSFAKVLHELGHGLTAYRYGCRVPTMGVAFLVLWPVLYTDTNEAWKLQSRRQRLQIGAAGMLAELALAACATLLWNFLPDGALRAGVFMLATTTWVITLALNASPFMRFDGYFLLVDWLNMPNLHSRAFALGRWWLREKLFGWGDPVPEVFPPRRHRFLIAFAFGTWLYRLTLFLSIALLVYHFFFKLLGIVLFAVEMIWFIGLPVWSEVKVWLQRRREMHWNRQTRRTAVAAGLLTLLLVLPWQSSVHAPAVLEAAQTQGLYAAHAGQITALPVRVGQAVKKGDILVQMSSPELVFERGVAASREMQLRLQVQQQPFDERLMAEGPALQKRWQAAAEAVAGLDRQLTDLTLRAPFDGRVAELNPTISERGWVSAGEKLLRLTGPRGVKAEAFVHEADLARLQTGSSVRFIANLPEQPAVHCRIADIDRLTLGDLNQPYLASTFGGPLPTQAHRDGRLLLLESTFLVRMNNCDSIAHTDRELPGTAILQGERRSLLGRALVFAGSVLRRESGF